jgi:hypothetical protein
MSEFVGCTFWRAWSRWPLMVATEDGGCCSSEMEDRPGNSGMKLRATAARSVVRAGENSATPSFPSESQELLGRTVGVAEHKGDCLSCLVLDSVTSQVVACYELRSGSISTTPNLHTILSPEGTSPSSAKSTFNQTLIRLI